MFLANTVLASPAHARGHGPAHHANSSHGSITQLRLLLKGVVITDMAASSQNVLEGIERRRAQLQANVDRLQKALVHWTTSEAEYEALKGKIQAVHDPTSTQIREIARTFEGLLVNEKEILEMLGKPPQAPRSANQVVAMISRRIDYVQQNNSTIEIQLEAAEKQLAGVDILVDPGVDNEEGLPMMDIEEELDEQGNEISSSINQTGSGVIDIVEALRKAGLQRSENTKRNADIVQVEVDTSANRAASSVPGLAVSDYDSSASASLKSKSVSFATGSVGSRDFSVSHLSRMKAGTIQKTPKSPRLLCQESASAETSVSQHGLAERSHASSTEAVELDEIDDLVGSYSFTTGEESIEDAELRREMLEYGLSEVGQVVAELELDQPMVSYSDDESDTDTEEEEDEYGRNTRSIITAKYRQQMLELEKRLGARMLENVGPPPDVHAPTDHVGDLRTMRIRKDDHFERALGVPSAENPENEPVKGVRKKGVRFADVVDVSVASSISQGSGNPSGAALISARTASDTITENTIIPTTSAMTSSRSAMNSELKDAAYGTSTAPQTLPYFPILEAQAVPSGPTGRTLASTIVEHVSTVSEPQPPDEFDPVLVQREIQAQYHKSRNKFISQQGGFKPSEADDESPIVENKNGKTKRVSRFMAGRLKTDGM
ncbi:hypothetical protein ACN47E_001355 [Coniothyrium glycines]